MRRATIVISVVALLMATFAGRARAETTPGPDDFEIIHVESTSPGIFWDTTTTWWRPVRGPYRQPVTYGDFFRGIARPEIAASEESRHATAEALFWGGLVVMVGGFAAGGYELFHHHDGGALVGAGLAVGGFVSLRIGSALSRPGVSESDARGMADGYNQTHERRVGLSLHAEF